ncbi:MAG: peptide-methionine (S)-S-oxide reductase MsrA [Candidatus Eremiobacteraeota bacterium]|nr:peptide-methionine (S)-S-oxide reductase MsrA [Candidatus Eremiobacteraeota bacterium]
MRIVPFLFTALILIAPNVARAAPSQTVVLAGGCFWGMEGVFESLKGVQSAVSGYAGGSAQTAHYEIVSTGMTGHAESVRVTFDPSQISFSQILQVYFFVAHDPTELNFQGPDEGTQYRSEIFYTTDEQRAESLDEIKRLDAQHAFPKPIVTQVAPLRGFYPAEAYHQHFMQKNMDNPYIVENDVPKLEALHAKFPQLVKR